MRVGFSQSLSIVFSFWALAACARAAPSTAPTRAFIDVTQPSGVGGVVAQHYADRPKWWLSGMTLVDLDGDGHLDLHLASHDGGAAAAAVNDGHGRFTRVDPKLSIPRTPRDRAVLPYPGGEIRLVFDVFDDGKPALLCSYGDGLGVLYRNETHPAVGAGGAPGTAWAFRPTEGIDPFSRGTAMADLDGDGLLDYLTDAGHAPVLHVFRGRGKGAFDSKPTTLPALKESAAIPVDLDNDGKLDLLITQRGYNGTARMILHNDAQGAGATGLHFTDVTSSAGLDAGAGSIHGVGDLDGDGSPDLICIEQKAVVIYLNDGHGKFTRRADLISGTQPKERPESTNWGGAVVVDLDNDGIPDVLVNGRHFLYVLRGLGGGRLAYANASWGIPAYDYCAVDEGLCFGDIDNDGRLDLVTCGPGPDGNEKGVRVFHNESPTEGHHWLRVRPIGKSGNRAATSAKIRLHDPGTQKLIACEQVAAWGRQSFHSYYDAAATERHFGLGERGTVDVSVEFYPSGKTVTKRGVKADEVVEVKEED